MSPRTSIIRGDSIEYSFWLVFGSDGSMRFSRLQQGLSAGERAMSMVAVLPKALFKTPQLSGRIEIAAPDSAEFKVDLQAASEALRQAIGVDIDLRINNGE